MASRQGKRDVEDVLDNETELTKRYGSALKEVYKKKGLWSALGYELSSTFYSLGKRLANFFDAEEYSSPTRKERNKPGYLGKNSNAEWLLWNHRQERRKRERANYLLREEKDSGLAGRITGLFFIIMGFVFGMLFLSNSITGNVIGGLSDSATSVLGISLIILCLIALFFWLRRKK